jgi:RNA polymerase sigma factor (sigma-70 family)
MAVTAPQIEALYREHGPRLHRLVGRDVGAGATEDACQFAWSRLLDHSERVRAESALSWLATTAVREAVRITRLSRRDESLEAELAEVGDAALPLSVADPSDGFERRERLRGLARLPVRQQRLLWLHGLGFSYEEIAEREGCTVRTVHREILRARHATREAA